MNAASWFPSQSAPNPNGGIQGLFDSYNQSQAASRNANVNLANDSLNWWGGVMNQTRSDLNQAAGYLRGTNKANNRDIDKRFSALSGNTAEGLIDRGLGNSTIQYSMQKGITNAHADALSRSRAEFGTRLYDAYSRNAQINSGLASQQLGFLGNINIGYPDFGAYAQMAGMMGGAQMSGSPFFGGGTTMLDPSRPVGGAQPAWAYYGGAGGDNGGVAGGGNWNMPGKSFGYAPPGQSSPGMSFGGWGGDMSNGTQSSLDGGYDFSYLS